MDNHFTPSDADLTILQHVEQEPDTTQASLAKRLGVAVGTINWHLKRLIEKGYIKVRRAERKNCDISSHLKGFLSGQNYLWISFNLPWRCTAWLEIDQNKQLLI